MYWNNAEEELIDIIVAIMEKDSQTEDIFFKKLFWPVNLKPTGEYHLRAIERHNLLQKGYESKKIWRKE